MNILEGQGIIPRLRQRLQGIGQQRVATRVRGPSGLVTPTPLAVNPEDPIVGPSVQGVTKKPRKEKPDQEDYTGI